MMYMIAAWKFIKSAWVQLVAAALGVLWLLVQHRTAQRDKARDEADRQAERAQTEATRGAQQRRTTEAVREVKQEAAEVQRENEEQRGSGDRPTGSFIDRRLRDD